MNKVEFLEKTVFFLDRKLIEWCVITCSHNPAGTQTCGDYTTCSGCTGHAKYIFHKALKF